MSVALWAAPAVAQPEAPAALIWYRSADGCPDGAAFLERLERRNVHARLAEVGDHIDFVVTLGAAGQGSAGRLERQTRTQTVAIRAFEAESCNEVADALALSLSVAMVPGKSGTGDAELPPDAQPPGAVPATSRPPMPSQRKATAHEGPVSADLPPSLYPSGSAGPSFDWLVGAAATARTGLLPELLPGASLYVDRGFGGVGLFRGSSLRAAVVGAFGSSPTPDGELELWVVAGRLDVCSLGVARTSTLSLRACLGTEIGATGARAETPTGQSDAGFFGAALAHAQLGWWLGRRFVVETEIGGAIPLKRYEYLSGPERTPLHRTAAIGFSAALGVGFALE